MSIVSWPEFMRTTFITSVQLLRELDARLTVKTHAWMSSTAVIICIALTVWETVPPRPVKGICHPDRGLLVTVRPHLLSTASTHPGLYCGPHTSCILPWMSASSHSNPVSSPAPVTALHPRMRQCRVPPSLSSITCIAQHATI